MSRSKTPIAVIFSMTLLGTLLSVIARFAYVAYIIVQAGESLNSLPLELLLIDVMELHYFALYGAGGGAILGIIFALVDLLRFGGRSDELTWANQEEIKPFVEDEVKAHRMEIGDRYLKENPPNDKNGNSK